MQRKSIERVLDCLRRGHNLRNACLIAGVNPERFQQRLNRSRRLQHEVERAQLEVIDRALRAIQQALQAGDVRAAMWVLERLVPERWGAKAKQEPQAVDIEPEFVVLDDSESA